MTNAFIDTLKSDVERKEGRKEGKKRKMPGTFNEAKC